MSPPYNPNTTANQNATTNNDTKHYIESLGCVTLTLWAIEKTTPLDGTPPIWQCTCPRGKDCKNPGKHPRPHATDSTNYGVKCNSESGVFVIDLDNKPGSHNGITNFKELVGERELPETFTVATPSGGYHFYFRHPGDREIATNAGQLALGVDVRGDGGYVVGPGSLHVVGATYRIVIDMPFSDAPEWLLDLVTKRATPAPSEKGVSAIGPDHSFWSHYTDLFINECQHGMQAIEGQGGDARLFEVVKYGIRDLCLPDEFVFNAIAEHFNPRCEPPWDPEELSQALVHKIEFARFKGHSATMTVPPKGWEEMAARLSVPKEIRPAPRTSSTSNYVANHSLANYSAPRNYAEESVGTDRMALETTPSNCPATPNYPANSSSTLIDTAPTSTVIDAVEEPFEIGQPATKEAAKKSNSEIMWLLKHSPAWENVFRWDEFRQDLIAIKPPCALECQRPRSGLPETDITTVLLWFEYYGMSVTRDNIRALIMKVAKTNSYHPVRDYLTSFTPKEDRKLLDTLATELFGCEHEHENLYLKLALIGAAKRIFEPGCEMHNMPILVAPQGVGKSTGVKTLFGSDWTRDQLSDLSSKDASQDLLGFWCVEVAELDKLLRTENSTAKAFLTRSTDRFRPPYERGTQEFPRQCVFFGTTNHEDFLRDETGERRYWPIRVLKVVDLDRIKALRDAIWSAVVWEVKQGTPHWLTYEQNLLLEPLKAEFALEDPWLDAITEYVRCKEETTCSGCFRDGHYAKRP
jgi:hypothetical protein